MIKKILFCFISASLAGCVSNNNYKTETKIDETNSIVNKELTTLTKPLIEENETFKDAENIINNEELFTNKIDYMIETKDCEGLFKDSEDKFLKEDNDYFKYSLLKDICKDFDAPFDKSFYLKRSFEKNIPEAIAEYHKSLNSPILTSEEDLWFKKLLIASNEGNIYSSLEIAKYFSFLGDSDKFKEFITKGFIVDNKEAYNIYSNHYFVEYKINKNNDVEYDFINSIFLNYSKVKKITYNTAIKQYKEFKLEKSAIDFLRKQDDSEAKYILLLKLNKELYGMKQTEEMDLLVERASAYKKSDVVQLFIYSYYKSLNSELLFNYLTSIESSDNFLVNYGFANYYFDNGDSIKSINYANQFIKKYENEKKYNKLRANMHFIIGTSNLRSINMNVNSALGIKELNIAAKLGHAKAHYELAYYYEIKKNQLKYLQYMNKSIELGFSYSNIKLGLDYSFNPKYERNLDIATRYFDIAIESNEYEGFYHLGKIYERRGTLDLPRSFSNYECYAIRYEKDKNKDKDDLYFRNSKQKIIELLYDMTEEEKASIYKYDNLCEERGF